MKSQITCVDSHIHLDLLYEAHPQEITQLQNAGCLPVSWAYGQGIHSARDLKAYLHQQSVTIDEISREGFPCFFLTGIHPRNIPEDLRPEDVENMLLPLLDHPLCLGIGEIGLETCGGHEREIFSAQLALAPEIDQRKKVFGVHTPRADKMRVTGKILEILDEFLLFRDRIIVDHCTVETIGEVLSAGFWAGITLSPAKSSVEELKVIVGKHKRDLGRILLNTDSLDIFYYDLVHLMEGNSLKGEGKAGLIRDNAIRFFGIPSKA